MKLPVVHGIGRAALAAGCVCLDNTLSVAAAAQRTLDQPRGRLRDILRGRRPAAGGSAPKPVRVGRGRGAVGVPPPARVRGRPNLLRTVSRGRVRTVRANAHATPHAAQGGLTVARRGRRGGRTRLSTLLGGTSATAAVWWRAERGRSRRSIRSRLRMGRMRGSVRIRVRRRWWRPC